MKIQGLPYSPTWWRGRSQHNVLSSQSPCLRNNYESSQSTYRVGLMCTTNVRSLGFGNFWSLQGEVSDPWYGYRMWLNLRETRSNKVQCIGNAKYINYYSTMSGLDWCLIWNCRVDWAHVIGPNSLVRGRSGGNVIISTPLVWSCRHPSVLFRYCG